MTTPALRIDGVSRRFGRTQALADVSFEVPENQICGLLGRNGAGKTTLMSIVAGHDRADDGTVQVFGVDPFEHAAAMGAVSFIRDNQRYPDDYYLKHVLRVGPLFHENWSAEIAEEVVERFRLPAKPPVKKYSRGQLSALGVLIGLASRAPLTIFDEPYLGLDAVARQLFYDRLIADYTDHPRTVVLSTHLIEEIGDLLERVLLIDRGRLLLADDADALRDSALTVSGPAERVSTFRRGRDVLHTESLGGSGRAVVRSAGPQDHLAAQTLGLAVEPTSLQQLVVALSRHSTPATDPGADRRPRLEEVS
jgi:ABC-2 type transport system ATP-binding protein